jgi:beta-lactamase regulating signal transducer with metallopeptidase domain/5-hydroxyisourate hydrolase-like protein (transthyretin family)
MTIRYLADAVHPAVLQASWQAAVLAAAVWVVCTAGRSVLPPGWRFALWMLVIVRLGLPLVPVSGWSLFNLVHIDRATWKEEAQTVPATDRILNTPPNFPQSSDSRSSNGNNRTAVGRVDAAHADTAAGKTVFPSNAGRQWEEKEDGRVAGGDDDRRTIVNSAASGTSATLVSSEPATTTSRSLTVTRCGALLWMGITALLVFRWGRLEWLMWRASRNWTEVADPDVWRIWTECLEQTRLQRRVRLVVSPDAIGPATVGVWRPVVVLPAWALTEVEAGPLRMVLLHELHHVRRWDVLWDRLTSVAAAVHWFNPVSWWALSRIRDEREAACDAAVLEAIGAQSARDYGSVVLSLATRPIQHNQCPAAVGVFGRKRSLTRRIEMIANHRPAGIRGTLVGATALGAFVLCGLTDARPPAPAVAKSALMADSAAASNAKQADTADNAAPAGAQAKQAEGETISIRGVCRDENGKPLRGVRVTLFRESGERRVSEKVAQRETDAAGSFEFGDVPAPVTIPNDAFPGHPRYRWTYSVAAQSPGRATGLQLVFSSDQAAIQFDMPPAGTIAGRVTNLAGEPIAGAVVSAGQGLTWDRNSTIRRTRTDEDGRFEIVDVAIWSLDAEEAAAAAAGREVLRRTGRYVSVSHPNYALDRIAYRAVPATADAVLRPAAVIEGRVVDQLTGEPAVGVPVTLRSVERTLEGTKTMPTDDAGRYRFTSVMPGRYNIWPKAENRTAVALNSFAVVAGDERTAPDLVLVQGGWIEGRVVDAVTGEPITHSESEVRRFEHTSGTPKEVPFTKDERRARIVVQGAARPRNAADAEYAVVDGRGHFKMRVAPGRHYPALSGRLRNRVEHGADLANRGVEVRDGEVVSVVFRVLPVPPQPSPAVSPVRLPLPVEEERSAADAIRRLGGWYTLDDERHVTSVNMVFHYTSDEVRYDNDQTDTDEALKWLPSFSRLTELYLTNKQVTDDSLRHIGRLEKLEALTVWDAPHLTEAGLQHLGGTKSLRRLSLGKTKVGDKALEVFGMLSNLEELNLGGELTDDGLRHLAGLDKLRSLFVETTAAPFSDAAAEHLRQLSSLRDLNLSKSQFTDAGIRRLGELKELMGLRLDAASTPDGPAITDASVDVLVEMKQLKSLDIRKTGITDEGLRRLAALPNMKRLVVLSPAFTHGIHEELEWRYPHLFRR